MVFTDLVVGVQAGVVAALVIAVFRLGQLRILFHVTSSADMHIISFSGPVTFLCATSFERLRDNVLSRTPVDKIILDLSRVTSMDATGTELLLDFLGELKSRNIQVAVQGMENKLFDQIRSYDRNSGMDVSSLQRRCL